MTLPFVPILLIALAAPPENAVLADLLDRGLPVDSDGKTRVKMAAPTMPDGLDAAAQRRVIEQVAGKDRRVEDLVRNAVVAPFVMKIEDLPSEAGADPLRRVDVWYVAYGKLDHFFSEEFFEGLVQMASSEKKSRYPLANGVLKPDELAQRGLKTADGPALKERYSYSTAALFDRVLLSATRRVVVTRQGESVLVAAVVDPRFAKDATHPNQWRPITVDDRGDFTLGEPRPYAASGSYSKITRLKEPAGALFIEHHQLFAEPAGWFGGKNFLRSKLPMAVQDTVRKLRFQLRAAEEKSNGG